MIKMKSFCEILNRMSQKGGGEGPSPPPAPLYAYVYHKCCAHLNPLLILSLETIIVYFSIMDRLQFLNVLEKQRRGMWYGQIENETD